MIITNLGVFDKIVKDGDIILSQTNIVQTYKYLDLEKIIFRKKEYYNNSNYASGIEEIYDLVFKIVECDNKNNTKFENKKVIIRILFDSWYTDYNIIAKELREGLKGNFINNIDEVIQALKYRDYYRQEKIMLI